MKKQRKFEENIKVTAINPPKSCLRCMFFGTDIDEPNGMCLLNGREIDLDTAEKGIMADCKIKRRKQKKGKATKGEIRTNFDACCENIENKLQKIFETETLETLNTIEFKYTQQKKKSSKKNNKASQSKENKKTNEEVSSEMTDDNTLEEHIAETKKESSDVRTITPPENITSHYDLSKVLG